MKIQTRVLAVLIITILITGAVGIIASNVVSRAIAEDVICNHLVTTVQSRANHIETFLDMNKQKVERTANGAIIRDLLTTDVDDDCYVAQYERVTARLHALAATDDTICEILLLNRNGTVVASTDESIVGSDKSSEDIFLEGRKQTYVGDVHACKNTGKSVMLFSAPVIKNAEMVGVIVTSIRMDDLDAITTDRTGLGETGEIYILNMDGYMITPSRFTSDTFLKQKVATGHLGDTPENLKNIGEGEYGHELITCKNYLGTNVIRTHTHINELGWTVVAEMSEEEAFTQVTGLARTMLIILTVLMVGGAVCSIIISGTLTEPILRLSRGAEKIEKGDLDYKVGTDSDNEIGDLSRSIDRMTGELKRSKMELEAHNASLEAQVTERTRKLTESEEYLKELVDKLRISQESLSAPVVQLEDGILALPLIGMIDEHRIATIMETLLSRITETQSDVVILDVTGVHEIDTYVTSQLIRIVRATQLLGATCIVTGVRPESAHTLVELGVDTSELLTRRTLQDGIRYAQKIVGGE
ncbi:MAG: HAMP domain-containing protein [Methanosarcinales archaeon]|nr:MAG: HAMP domain-containing protein [Methanosarcinales archaeon]